MDCFLHVDLYHFYTAGTLSCRIGGTKFISAFQVLEECYIPLSMCMTACMIDCTIALGYWMCGSSYRWLVVETYLT